MKQTINQGRYLFPVKGCLFFGVPHTGAEFADRAFAFLNVLSFVFDVNKSNIKDLESKSQRFAKTSSEFRAVQTEQEFPVISFFETVKYKHHGVVSWSFTLRSRDQGWKLLYHFLKLNSTSSEALLCATFLGSIYCMLGLDVDTCENLFPGTLCTKTRSPDSSAQWWVADVRFQ